MKRRNKDKFLTNEEEEKSYISTKLRESRKNKNTKKKNFEKIDEIPEEINIKSSVIDELVEI